MDEERLPAVLVLRPGLEIVRRDAERLQVGLGPDAVTLPDTPDVRELLSRLEAGAATPPDEPESWRWCLLLWRAGLLVDAAAWWRDRIRWPLPAAAAYARGPAGRSALAQRVEARIGLSVEADWTDELGSLLGANGLTTGRSTPDVVVVGGLGEPDRARLDALMAAGTPHLVIRGDAGDVTLGPFVVPGRTACLRCEDAHRTDRDPRWPLLLAQLPSALTPRASRECPPEPALLTVALAWAVRDLTTYVEGGRPATWSTTVAIGPGLDLPRRQLLRHPHCGCAWGDLVATG